MPTLQGGGISEAMGLVGGVFSFNWLRSLVGTVTLSLLNFIIGVPLGNEGPSVQIGASIGKASTLLLGKKGEVWSRYCLTGGTCSGFAAATGAAMTGIIFLIEEMHRRLSPMIIIISIVSVAACRAVTELLCPFLGMEAALFPSMALPSLHVSDLWVPLLIGIGMGIFSVAFLLIFKGVNSFINKKLSKINKTFILFAILALTVIFGSLSTSYVSTGHHLIAHLLEPQAFSYSLLTLLAVRMLLTLSANAGGLTGGLFLPTLAISAVSSALLSQVLIATGAVSPDYYTVIVVLGVVAGMAGIMKVPFTAILFSLEVLSCSGNLLAITVVAGAAFAVTELFHSKSINDLAMEIV